METKVTIYATTGPRQSAVFDLPAIPTTAELRAVVEPLLDGGAMDRMAVWDGMMFVDMFVDRNAAAKQLPLNQRATEIARAEALAFHKPTPLADTLPAVHGPAVVFARPVYFAAAPQTNADRGT